ncbi:MAG: hypothetical protein R3F20_01330 [Planctomycetota bacterium]
MRPESLEELPWLLVAAALATTALVLRRRPGRRALGRRLFLLALLIALLPALAPSIRRSFLRADWVSTRVVILDASRSQGPELSRRFRPRELVGDVGGNVGSDVLFVLADRRAGVVYEGPVDDLPERLELPASLLSFADRGDFDLLAGLRAAREHPGGQGRLDLVIATRGGFDARELAARVAPWLEFVTSVRVVDAPGEPADDLSITFVSSAPRREAGRPFAVEVEVFGPTTRARRATVEVSGAGSRSVTLAPDLPSRRLRFEVAADWPAGEPVTARLLGVEDWDRDRSGEEAFLRPREAGGEGVIVRILSSDPAAARALGRRLAAAEPRLEPRVVDGMAALRTDGAGRPSVAVLLDVPADPYLAGGRDALLRDLAESGGGILLAGSRGAFAMGGWEGTEVDAISPVRSRPGDRGLAVSLLLDRSGSMDRAGRAANALAAARRVVAALGAEDRVRLGAFADDVALGDWREPAALGVELAAAAPPLPRGGTDLVGALRRLIADAGDPERREIVFLLTDGQDERLADPAVREELARGLAAGRRDLQIFWFDREEERRPWLRALAEAGRGALIEIDDFGALARAFIRRLGGEALVEDAAIRDVAGGSARLARLLRTGPREGIEILAGGGGRDRVALARWSVGAGRVAALPTDLDAASVRAVFGAEGDAGLARLLLELAPPEDRGIGELRRLGEGGIDRLEIAIEEGRGDGFRLRRGTLVLELERRGLERWRSAALPEDLDPAGPFVVENGAGRTLARREIVPEDPFDRLPPPARADGLELESALRAALPPTPPRRDGAPRLLLTFALLLLAVDLGLRGRGL